jgi:hypothetical protein
LQDLTLAIHRRFDAILSTYDQLGDLVLFTLRAELRCSVMHYCEVSMSKVRVISPVMPPLLTCSKYQGNYRIENEADEPDPYILDLTADLGECHGVMMSKLPEEDIRQVDSREIECSLTCLDTQLPILRPGILGRSDHGLHGSLRAVRYAVRSLQDPTQYPGYPADAVQHYGRCR